MTISPSGPNHARIAGETSFILKCSSTITPNPLPDNVSSPKFEWFFGPTNTSLPSGVTVSNVTNSGNTYTSTLQFPLLQESLAGMNLLVSPTTSCLSCTSLIQMARLATIKIGLVTFMFHVFASGKP